VAFASLPTCRHEPTSPIGASWMAIERFTVNYRVATRPLHNAGYPAVTLQADGKRMNFQSNSGCFLADFWRAAMPPLEIYGSIAIGTIEVCRGCARPTRFERR
jgi:hypothetical protein